MTISRSRIWCIVLAGALVAPARLSGQGEADSLRTHVVKVGDTLWSLAASYLGNGQRWREILRLNSDVFTSQDSLPIGATIRIPAQRARAAARPASPPPQAPAPARVTPPPATPPATPPAREERPPAPPAVQAPPPEPDLIQTAIAISGERTVFYGAQPGGGFGVMRADSSGGTMTEDVPAPPPGVYELLAAPYVLDAATLSRAGTCLAMEAGTEIASGAAVGGALLRTAMTIAPPSAASVRDGDRFVLVREASAIPGLGRVVVPTGVVRVAGPDAPRKAEIVAQFDAISCTDRLVVPSQGPVPGVVETQPVSAGPAGRVVWVGGDALLPTLQHSVIVDIGASDGVRPGDRFSIFGADGAIVATAAVVRVDGLSSTGIIVRRPQAGIVSGLRAQVTGKAP